MHVQGADVVAEEAATYRVAIPAVVLLGLRMQFLPLWVLLQLLVPVPTLMLLSLF